MHQARRLVYPEIEHWPAIGTSSKPKETAELIQPIAPNCEPAYIDILEVADNIPRLTRCPSDGSVLQHFAKTAHLQSQNGNEEGVALRIFFIEELHLPSNWKEPESNNIASWMMDSFGVSPLFFQLMSPEVLYRHDGGTSFPTRDADGTASSVDGFYQISAGIISDPSFLWFKHALSQDKAVVSSTYICYKCPEAAKQKITSLVLQRPTALMRPLSIDALIVAERLHNWGEVLQKEHNSLRYYINGLEKKTKLFELDTQNVHNLRNLAEHFHVIRTVLEDLREHIEYLSRIHQNSAYSHFFQPKLYGQEYGAVRESLSHLLSQTKTMTRWVSSYVDHTDIVMNHLFNLFSLSISDFTSRIAISTQQDSSSMITMAAVTMFFLPGTFVSALFSMVFFNANETNTGLSVNSQIWLFFAVTVPLTIAVFAIWELWRRSRQRSQEAQGQTALASQKSQAQSIKDVGIGMNNEGPLTFGLSDMRKSPSIASHSIIPRSLRSRSSSASIQSNRPSRRR